MDDFERKDIPVFPEEQDAQPSAPRRSEYADPTEAAPEQAPYTKPEAAPAAFEAVPEVPEAPAEPVAPEVAPIAPEAVPVDPEVKEIPSQYPEQPQPAQYPHYSSSGAYQPNQPYGAYQPNQPYNQNRAPGQPYAGYTPYGQAPDTRYPSYNTQQYPPYNGAPYGAQPPVPPKKKNKGLKVFFLILAMVVLLGVVFTVVAYYSGDNDSGGNPSTSTSTTVNSPVIETQSSPSTPSDVPSGSSQTLTSVQIAAKVKPWVVGIVVYSNSSGSASSEGSGILWKEDSDGYTYIITCAHVIAGSGLSYTVQTEDGTQYDAERVGFDTKTDLGILKVKKTGLSLAEFGDSSALKVGDSVYAVGNPGGTEFFGSFTSGVVSAIDRSVKSTYTMVCIQHDAAINPGNSGGALVNSYGQVVGINSLKIIDTEYEGMGFAIPIKSAQSVVNSLTQHGYVPNRPKLGITYAEAIDYQQYSMIVKIKGLPSGSLIITDISEDSGFVGTDAKQYDMIIAVDGEDLTTADVLIDKIENSKVGDTLKLTLCRVDNNYKITQFDVSVKLVEDKGNTETETTTSAYINPYDFFNGLY